MLSKFYKLIPRPVVLVTTIDKDRKINAAPFSFISPLSFNPPLIMISSAKERHTYQNIKETKEFVLNIIDESWLEKALVCAKNFPKGINELEEAGLSWEECEKVKPPRVKEAKAWIECKFKEEKEEGDHFILIGEVVNFGGSIENLNLVFHIGMQEFLIGKEKKYYKWF